jgi:NAD(P)-dependent dehydrogenase (short-subunit alcohol dehydrogenase family)
MTALLERQAVLTGAAGGIGGAIARELLAQGATVHGIDRDSDGLRSLAQEFSGRFIPYSADLADRGATDRMLGLLDTALAGRCDILVNNAGLARVQSFVTTEDVLIDRLFAVNFTAVFRVTRALIPALRASRRASVVNIASELALIGQPGYTAYSATKGAILAFSRALAAELAVEGIRVNAVCPGPIDTSLLAGEFALADDPVAARAGEIATVPLGRLGVPRDIAGVVAFLAGDAAGFVTGAAWVVDGGKTAR